MLPTPMVNYGKKWKTEIQKSVFMGHPNVPRLESQAIFVPRLKTGKFDKILQTYYYCNPN